MKITKKGLWKNNSFNEYHVEPDGSLWQLICYHNRPSENLFNQSDNFSEGVFLKNDLQLNANILNDLTSWEFLWVEKAKESDTPVKYRWIQSKNPLTATYDDVKPGQVEYNSSSGYTNSNMGGLIKKDNINTYLSVCNSYIENWNGAIGCKKRFYGGIPAHPQSGKIITTGSILLYVKISNPTSKAQNINISITNDLYEI